MPDTLIAASEALVAAVSTGSAWYLTRRTYTRSSDAKRYAVASVPLDTQAGSTFETIPEPVTHGYLIQGTVVLALIAFDKPILPTDAPVLITPGWWTTLRAEAFSDEEQASLDGAIATLTALKAKLEDA